MLIHEGLTDAILAASIEVQRTQGPGLLESIQERLLPVLEAQLLTYLRATCLHIGLLLNFNAPTLWIVKGVL